MAAGGGGARPRFVRPAGSESLYPSDKDSSEVLISSTADASLVSDGDAKSTFVYNRYHHLPLDTQRQRLPVFQYRNHILHLLERYQTLVLVGETGSGKSTQVPQYACEVGHRVCVTQPRVTATVALAGRVAAERGELCGGRVGYSVSMDAKRSQETDIVFMTEGVLLREMFASPLLTQYTCVVLDEVHERTQLTDVLMGLLKKIAKKRKKLKIIISSATMDAEYLRGFFNLNAGSGGGESTSVIMSVQGRTHPIDVFYVRDPVPNYVKATVDTVIKIHENKPFGDILAFLTSQEEILDAIDTLESYATDNNSRNKHRARFPSGITACDMRILPMYGSLAHHRQLRVFQMADKNVRKVIVATNIAETSVTVPGVSYVIDCGFHKLPYFDPSIGVESIAICKISQANATQRAGRAGRISKGECYRLYTEEEFEKMAPSVPPEMQRSEMSSVILQLKALGIHNVLRFSFPTPPPAKCLLSGLETLYALGAIDKDGQLTSELGQYMAELPLKPTLAKMLCNSGEFGCIEEALSIVAMLHVENIFVKSKSGQENIKAKISKRNNFEVAEGDLMTYLNIFDGYTKVEYEEGNDRQRQKARKAWCRKMYLNDRVMEKVFEVRRTLEKLIKYKFKMKDTTFEGYDLGSAKTERIQKCIMSGLFPQASRLGPTGTYLSLSRDAQLHISPDSCLHNASQPQWVVFTSVQCVRDKTYMRDVTAIKKEWLLQIAPHFYRQN